MPALIPLAVAGVSAAATAYGAHKASSAADRAAKQQTSSANYAADIQGRGNTDTLNFQKQQAAEDARRFELTQRANYDQWAARENRLGSLSQMMGLGNRGPIPGYVSSGATGVGGPTSGGGSTDPRVADIFNKVTQGLAPTAENLPTVIKALNDAGISATRATHAGNLPSDDFINFGGGGGLDVIQNVGSPNAKWQMLAPQAGGGGGGRSVMGTLAQMANMPVVRPGMPTDPYVAPSTLRSYLRRA
jgi:hypothetical protein